MDGVLVGPKSRVLRDRRDQRGIFLAAHPCRTFAPSPLIFDDDDDDSIHGQAYITTPCVVIIIVVVSPSACEMR